MDFVLQISDWFTRLPSAIVTLFFAGVTLVVISLGTAMAVFGVLLAQLQLWIGFTLGPFLLAFTVLESFRSILSTWFQYILGGMFKIVIMSVVTALFFGLISAIASVPAAMMGQPSLNYVFMSILGFGMIMAIKHVDGMASGLTGGFSIGGPSAASIMGSAGKVAGAGLASSRGVGGVVGGGLGAVGGAVKGGISGARSDGSLAQKLAGVANGVVGGGLGGLERGVNVGIGRDRVFRDRDK